MPLPVCVFSSAGLKRLRQRIDELKDEKEELRKNQKQLRKEHVLVMPHACLPLHFRRLYTSAARIPIQLRHSYTPYL